VIGVINYRQNNERALKQSRINQAQIVGLKAADRRLKVTDRRIRHALAEVCHAQTITFGILNAVVVYFINQYPHPNENVRTIIQTLTGYARDLGQMTACENITRP
jgi:hypothetical protein